MQSKTSYSKFLNGTIIKRDLLHFLPAWGIYFLVLLVRFPLKLLMALSYINEQNGYQPEEIPGQKAMECIWHLSSAHEIAIFAVAGLILGMLLFHYLHFQRSTNMMHAYPVTRGSLFWSHVLSAGLMLLIPSLVTGLLEIGISASVHPGLAGPAGFFLLWLLIAPLFFFSLTVLCMMATGLLAFAPVFYLLLLNLADGLRFFAYMLAGTLNYGCSTMTGNAREQGMGILSPLRCFSDEINFTVVSGDNGVKWEQGVTYTGTASLLIYLGVSICFLLLSMLCYRRRKLEDVGKVITVRFLRPVFQWGVTFAGAMMLVLVFFNRDGFFGPSVIDYRNEFAVMLIAFLCCSVGIWYLLTVIMHRKWRVMNGKRWAELIAFCGVFTVILAMVENDAFGLEKKLPGEGEIELVEISMENDLIREDGAAIAEVRALHEELIREKAEVEEALCNRYDQSVWLSITYYLKDGNTLLRTYVVPRVEETVSLPSMALMDQIDQNEDYFLYRTFGMNYPEAEYTGATLNLYDLEAYANEDYESLNFAFSEEETNRILEAYHEDFVEGSLFQNYQELPTWYDQYCSDLQVQYRVPDGKIHYQYELVENFEKEHGIPGYEDGGSVTYEAASDQGSGMGPWTDTAWLPLNERCVHTMEALEEMGYFEGGYGLVP